MIHDVVHLVLRCAVASTHCSLNFRFRVRTGIYFHTVHFIHLCFCLTNLCIIDDTTSENKLFAPSSHTIAGLSEKVPGACDHARLEIGFLESLSVKGHLEY